MAKSIRSRLVFIVALIRSFVNDVFRKQKPEAKTASAEGVYRQADYPAPKPLWRTWWEEKCVASKLFWSKTRKAGKTSIKVLVVFSLLFVVVGGLYVGFNRDKEAEAVITRVQWSCNGYVKIRNGESTSYYHSKAFQGEGLVAKCPSGPSDDWLDGGDPYPMYRVTFWVNLTYPHGGYANETITFSFDDPMYGNNCHCLSNSDLKPGMHWKVRRVKRYFWRYGTELVQALPQQVEASKQ